MSSPLIILDELEDKLNSLKSDLSGTINNINTNVAINNTPSATGTVSQKLSQLLAINSNHGTKTRTAVGTEQWVCPNNVSFVMAVVIGSGGGGGGSWYASDASYRTAGRGGGAGAMECGICSVIPGKSYTITVGSIGIGGDVDTAGSTAGDSIFGTFITACGGGFGGGGGDVYYQDRKPGGLGGQSSKSHNCFIVCEKDGNSTTNRNGASGNGGKGAGGTGGAASGKNPGSSGSPGMVILMW